MFKQISLHSPHKRERKKRNKLLISLPILCLPLWNILIAFQIHMLACQQFRMGILDLIMPENSTTIQELWIGWETNSSFQPKGVIGCYFITMDTMVGILGYTEIGYNCKLLNLCRNSLQRRCLHLQDFRQMLGTCNYWTWLAWYVYASRNCLFSFFLSFFYQCC